MGWVLHVSVLLSLSVQGVICSFWRKTLSYPILSDLFSSTLSSLDTAPPSPIMSVPLGG